MPRSRRTYTPAEEQELGRYVRGLFREVGVHVLAAGRTEDYAGVDYTYTVHNRCPVAVRHRPNRPPGAARVDVTFRTTEPARIEAGTYAPIAIWVWTRDGRGTEARAVDIYQMHQHLRPRLYQRPARSNGDGTSFVVVTMAELDAVNALLAQAGDDPTKWHGGPQDWQERLAEIAAAWPDIPMTPAPAPAPVVAPPALGARVRARRRPPAGQGELFPGAT